LLTTVARLMRSRPVRRTAGRLFLSAQRTCTFVPGSVGTATVAGRWIAKKPRGCILLAELPLGDALEPGALDVVCLDAPLWGGPLRKQASEHAPRDPNHATVRADLDPELHRLPLGVLSGVLGDREEHRGLRSRAGGHDVL
jgi:hypothetical protein